MAQKHATQHLSSTEVKGKETWENKAGKASYKHAAN